MTALLYRDAPGQFSSWGLSAPVANRRGGKSVFLLAPDASSPSAHPLLQLAGDGDEPLRLLRGHAAGGKNLDLVVEEGGLASFLRTLDDFTRGVAAERCGEWFGKALPAEDVARMHNPLLLKDELGRLLLRVRLHGALNVWRRRRGEEAYDAVDAAQLQAGAPCWLAVAVSGLYFLPRSFGLTLTATDVLLLPAQRAFPFASARPLRLAEGPEDLDFDPPSDDERRAAA